MITNYIDKIEHVTESVADEIKTLNQRMDLLLDYNTTRMNAERKRKFCSIADAAKQKRQRRKECKRWEQIARRREIRKRSGRV